jgi:hypothetical protein
MIVLVTQVYLASHNMPPFYQNPANPTSDDVYNQMHYTSSSSPMTPTPAGSISGGGYRSSPDAGMHQTLSSPVTYYNSYCAQGLLQPALTSSAIITTLFTTVPLISPRPESSIT